MAVWSTFLTRYVKHYFYTELLFINVNQEILSTKLCYEIIF